MLSRIILCASIVAQLAVADTLVLKSGKTVEGAYLGGDSRKIRIASGDRVDVFDISEVSEIKFGNTTEAAAVPAPAPAAVPATRERIELMRPERDPEPKPAPVAAVPAGVDIPSGTNIVIRMIDDVDSERDRVGQTFRASIDEPLMIDGETVIPRGADVVAKIIEDKESGKLTGKTELTLDLVSVQARGRMIDVNTQEVTTASESRTGKSAKVVGGTAALGAIIGAIAGGGKGAAIGAVSGAGAGTAVQVLTKGQRVRIPSETRLTFVLQQPIRI